MAYIYGIIIWLVLVVLILRLLKGCHSISEREERPENKSLGDQFFDQFYSEDKDNKSLD